jgi:uncharacterized protein YuzE
MKLKIDQEADPLYFTLSDAPAAESKEVSPGVIVDYDETGHAEGMETFYLPSRVVGMDAPPLLFETVPVISGASPEREAAGLIASQPQGLSCGVSMLKGKRT